MTSPSGENPAAGKLSGWQHFTSVQAGSVIAARSQESQDVFVLCAGWAFRYLQLPDGRRQILRFLLPGDLLAPLTIFESSFDVSVKALTDVQVSGFARSELRARCSLNPSVQKVIVSCCVAEARDINQLVTALGQFSAEERIANAMLHLISRIAATNVIREQRYPFPLRQQHIADSVGLTPVHVSRVLSAFRKRRLLSLSEGVLTVFDLPKLRQMGSLN